MLLELFSMPAILHRCGFQIALRTIVWSCRHLHSIPDCWTLLLLTVECCKPLHFLLIAVALCTSFQTDVTCLLYYTVHYFSIEYGCRLLLRFLDPDLAVQHFCVLHISLVSKTCFVLLAIVLWMVIVKEFFLQIEDSWSMEDQMFERRMLKSSTDEIRWDDGNYFSLVRIQTTYFHLTRWTNVCTE